MTHYTNNTENNIRTDQILEDFMRISARGGWNRFAAYQLTKFKYKRAIIGNQNGEKNKIFKSEMIKCRRK